MTIHGRPIASPASFYALLAAGTLFACGGDGGDQDSVNDLTRAAEEIKAAAEQMAAGETPEPIDFRELKELLPEQVIGWTRVEHEGQAGGAAGFKVSTASGTYRAEDAQYATITMEIIDTGGLGSLAAMGMAHWLSMEIDREDESGFQRTTEFEGYPAYEEFNGRNGDVGSANLSFVVDRRFIVQVRGSDVSMKDVKDAAEALDVDRLAKLAKE